MCCALVHPPGQQMKFRCEAETSPPHQLINESTSMATASDETVELRMQAQRLVIDVLDAVSTARRISRAEMANRVLEKWARGVIHEATVIQSVTRGNPAVPANAWQDTDT